MIKKIKQKLFKNRQETVLELICNVLSCWLITVGVCLVLDAQLSFQIGLKPILWQTLFTVLVLFLFTRRWWIPIIYFGILVPVFFIAVSLSGDIYSFFKSFAGFFSWLTASMPIGSEWYSDQGFYLVHTFINIGVCVLFFAVLRITKRAWTVVLLAFGFIIVNYVKGYTDYDKLALLFFVVGIFPLIAGEKFQNIKLPDFRNLFGVLGKKWLLVIISTVVAVTVSLLSLGVASIATGSVRNRFCSEIVADIQTATNTFTKEQKKLNITLFDLGLVTNSGYIGGNLYEIEPKILATTDLTDTALVKVTAFDTFDGANWINTFNKGYRINGIWDSEQALYLSSRLKDDVDFVSEIDEIAYRVRVNITLKKDAFFLPTIGQVYNFSENTATVNPILFDARGRLFSYYGLPEDYSYTIDSFIYDTKQDALAKQMNGFYMSSNKAEDPLYDTESEFYKLHTKPIVKLPKKLKKDIERMNLDIESPYNAAKKICEYLSAKNGYIYTDTPSAFTKGDNIVERLFKTKKGHCIYYTAAMIAMARSVGVPSRLAAGYKTIASPDGRTQIIDKSSPYAWVECYIPNVGWMTFDPSPLEDAPQNSGSSQSVGNKLPAPTFDVEVEKQKEEMNNNEPQRKQKSVGHIPLIVLLILAVLVIIYAVVNTLVSYKLYTLEAVRKRFTKTTAQTKFYYKDILRQYSWLGFRFKKGETISELTHRVCTVLNDDSAQKLIDGIGVIEEVCYGNSVPTDSAVEAVFCARKALEEALVNKNNKVFYILKRRLLLPMFNFPSKVNKI